MAGDPGEMRGSGRSEVPTEAENYTKGLRHHWSNNEKTISIAQQQAQNYLNKHKIYELFNFLIGHLLVDEPDDPHEYLSDLLTKCQLFRLGLGEPPLLFTSRHIESMFQSLDPSGVGSISLEQYRTGMKTLGISEYDQKPVECEADRVDKQTFQAEAKKCLVKALAALVEKSEAISGNNEFI